jgi:predicted nucleic acid-binding Zn ribbon protein
MPWQPLPGDAAGEPQPVRDTVDRLVQSWGAGSAGTTRSLFADWDDIVGPQLAHHVRPRSLRQGTLVLAVTDPAWATQLRFLEAELLERIRAATASSEVSAIQVRVVRPGA